MSGGGGSKSNSQRNAANGETDPNGGDVDSNGPSIFIDRLNSAIGIPGDPSGHKEITIEKPFQVGSGPVDISFEAGFTDRSKDTISLRPLVIYFVLDVTASMGVNIDTIKSGIQSFVTKLSAKKFDVKMGYITFKDNVGSPSALMDAATLSSGLGNISTIGGGRPKEASLTAFRSALNFVLSQGAADAIKAILTITDNPGHNENIEDDTNVTDCTIEKTLSAINALPGDQRNLVKIFHSVSDEKADSRTASVDACSGFNSAKEQWNDILSKALPEIPIASRGGALPYPFKGDVLEKDFISLLERTSPGADLVCLVSKADLMINGEIVESTRYDDLSALYKNHIEGTPFVWKNAVPESRLADLANNNKNQLLLNSCCVLKASADSGKFGKCDEEKKITVNFKVTTK
jgi:hypothetical protein